MNHQQMMKPMLVVLAAVVVLAVAGAPVLGYAPLLVVLMCPLMMVLMMGAMMGHGHTGAGDQERSAAAPDRHDVPDR
jgi:hypothetical protein